MGNNTDILFKNVIEASSASDISRLVKEAKSRKSYTRIMTTSRKVADQIDSQIKGDGNWYTVSLKGPVYAFDYVPDGGITCMVFYLQEANKGKRLNEELQRRSERRYPPSLKFS